MGEFCLLYYLRNFRTESTDPTDLATDLTGLQQIATIFLNLTVYFIFLKQVCRCIDIFAILLILLTVLKQMKIILFI